MMVKPIYITGAGVVSAIGVGKAETLASMKAGKTGVGPMKYLPSVHQDIPVGEVKLSNAEMMQMLGVADSPQLSRTVLMGRIALREALAEARLSDDHLRQVPFISATTVGGMDRRELYHAQERDCDKAHAVLATQGCGSSTQMIAAPFGRFASLMTVSTACSSATNAIITGANMLRCGLADIVVVGGSECLSMFHLNGFNTLMILDTKPIAPSDSVRLSPSAVLAAMAMPVMPSTRPPRRPKAKELFLLCRKPCMRQD